MTNKIRAGSADNLPGIAREIRKTVIRLANTGKCPHIGSSLSCIDIMTTLFFKKMNFDKWEERDIFILSKAHASMALFAVLAERGILDRKMLHGFCKNGGNLATHLDRFSAKGIEVSAGSLGHGFNIGLGMAYGFRRKRSDRKVYVILGDGEIQEGSIWEGALFASRLGIDNFTAIVDCNRLQGYGRPNEICYFEPMAEKWKAFGWLAIEVDGHNFDEIESALNIDSQRKPKIIIARTVKGKGVSFMEDQLVWHYYIVTDKHKEDALKELL